MRWALTLALLLVPSTVEAQTDSVRAFALDTNARHLDSVIARAKKDTTVLTQRNGPNVVIWMAPYAKLFQLRDSLRVWCTGSCRWEWDTLIPGDTMQVMGNPEAVNTWGVDAVKAPVAWAMGFRGQGVILTSLDSGIDPNHPGYTVAGGYNAVTRTESGWSDDIPGCNGHGTHVAGTLAGKNGYGVAPDARLFGIKVFEPLPCGSYVSSQAAGIQWAADHGSRCINISISGANSYGLNQLIGTLRQRGVLVTRANGNSGITPPNGTTNEIQTASVNSSLTRSGFSNYGPDPRTDVAGPGEGIVSTMPGGGYGTKSGTSMAAPHACGVIGLVMSANPALTADEVLAILQRTAQPIGASPNDYTGYGLVRADKAVAEALGGVWVVGDTLQTITGAQETCFPMVSTKPYTVGVTAGVAYRQVGDTLCLTLTESTPRQVQVTLDASPVLAGTIVVDTLTRYQTITGWEATGQVGQESAGFPGWQGAVVDSAVALGLTRIRVEIHSGAQNPEDYYLQYRAGTITREQWRAKRYTPSPGRVYQFGKLDEQVAAIVTPLRVRGGVQVSLNYVNFGGNTYHATNPTEYAELILATFQHLQTKYGWVPEALEVLLEPDNGTGWTATQMGQAILAVRTRLASAGFTPQIIAPSTMSMAQAVPWLNGILATGAQVDEVSYHRYAGVSESALAGIATRAAQLGIRTSMLEHIGSGLDALWADLTIGNVSAWQQYTVAFPTDDNGAQYFPIVGTTVTTGSRTRDLGTVFRAVRPGMVRVKVQGGMGFVSPMVVVVRSVGGTYGLRGLRPGRYSLSTGGTFMVGSTGAATISIPAGLAVLRGEP